MYVLQYTGADSSPVNIPCSKFTPESAAVVATTVAGALVVSVITIAMHAGIWLYCRSKMRRLRNEPAVEPIQTEPIQTEGNTCYMTSQDIEMVEDCHQTEKPTASTEIPEQKDSLYESIKFKSKEWLVTSEENHYY